MFIAVPKTGTRTIYKVLEEQYDGRRQVDHQISVPGVNRNFFTFIIKRNPYDRICSVYWALCRRNPKSDAYGWIKSLNERGLANNLENFLLIVKSGKKHRVNHPIPQYKYYRGNRIDRVLRFENLQEDFNQLPFVKGPFELPHANRTVGAAMCDRPPESHLLWFQSGF